MKRVLLALVLLLAISGIIVLLLKSNKPTKVAVQPAIKINAADLFAIFEANEKKGDEMYKNKLLEVTGEIGEILVDSKEKNILILKAEGDYFGVKCRFSDDQYAKTTEQRVGDIATIRGFCAGKSAEGLDVELNKCAFVPAIK